jgi:hypothetical protein
MSSSIKILLIVSLVPFALSEQNCKAKIFIRTDVENVKLFINDNLESEGNQFEIELEPGIYAISVIEDYKKWNAGRIEDTLRIIDCSELTFNYELNKKLLLDSYPQNVYVRESDSLIGFTPMMLEKNIQTILLKKPGYEDKIISQQEIASGLKPEMKFIGQIKGESFYESTLFKLLVGTAIALGATTAYYKLEADKNFDEYQITGDPALLEQTDKYDLISAVTFVALQIDFGLILYLFLTD